MKNKKIKGFTIVELVIVIVIIAILAAVLIPTFASIISRANESSDIQAARQMNSALAAESALAAPDNIDQVIVILKNAGYNTTEKLKPVSAGYNFYWYKTFNQILLVEEAEGEDPARLVYPTENVTLSEQFSEDIGSKIAQNHLSDGGYDEDIVLFRLSTHTDAVLTYNPTEAGLIFGGNITLTEDTRINNTIVLSNKTVLDLNGKTLTIASTGSFIIEDSFDIIGTGNIDIIEETSETVVSALVKALYTDLRMKTAGLSILPTTNPLYTGAINYGVTNVMSGGSNSSNPVEARFTIKGGSLTFGKDANDVISVELPGSHRSCITNNGGTLVINQCNFTNEANNSMSINGSEVTVNLETGIAFGEDPIPIPAEKNVKISGTESVVLTGAFNVQGNLVIDGPLTVNMNGSSFDENCTVTIKAAAVIGDLNVFLNSDNLTLKYCTFNGMNITEGEDQTTIGLNNQTLSLDGISINGVWTISGKGTVDTTTGISLGNGATLTINNAAVNGDLNEFLENDRLTLNGCTFNETMTVTENGNSVSIELSSATNFNGLVVPNDKTVTITTNGNEVSGTIKNGSVLNITDGTIAASIENNGTLTINDGTVNAAITNNGTLSITNGSIAASNIPTRGTVTLTNVTVNTGDTSPIAFIIGNVWGSNVVTYNNCTFKNDYVSATFAENAITATVLKDDANLGEFTIASGKSVKITGSYTVSGTITVKGTLIIDSAIYDSIKDSIICAEDGKVLVLDENDNITEYVGESFPVDGDPMVHIIGLVGNGVTYTNCTFGTLTASIDGPKVTLGSGYTLSENVTLNGDKEITISGNTLTVGTVTVTGGTLTLQGNIAVTSSASASGSLVISGATITVTGDPIAYIINNLVGKGITYTNCKFGTLTASIDGPKVTLGSGYTLSENVTLNGDKEITISGNTLTVGTVTVTGGTLTLTGNVAFKLDDTTTIACSSISISNTGGITLTGAEIDSINRLNKLINSSVTLENCTFNGTMTVNKSNTVTIMLLEDNTDLTGLSTENGVTIVLNGKTLTLNSYSNVTLTGTGNISNYISVLNSIIAGNGPALNDCTFNGMTVTKNSNTVTIELTGDADLSGLVVPKDVAVTITLGRHTLTFKTKVTISGTLEITGMGTISAMTIDPTFEVYGTLELTGTDSGNKITVSVLNLATRGITVHGGAELSVENCVFVNDAAEIIESESGLIVTLKQDATINELEITQNVTINLNGRKLTITSYTINGGTLTIQGEGTISGSVAILNDFLKNDSLTMNGCTFNGTMTVTENSDNVTIELTKGADLSGLSVPSGKTVEITGAYTLTLNSLGTISGSLTIQSGVNVISSSVAILNEFLNSGSLTLSGCTFNGTMTVTENGNRVSIVLTDDGANLSDLDGPLYYTIEISGAYTLTLDKLDDTFDSELTINDVKVVSTSTEILKTLLGQDNVTLENCTFNGITLERTGNDVTIGLNGKTLSLDGISINGTWTINGEGTISGDIDVLNNLIAASNVTIEGCTFSMSSGDVSITKNADAGTTVKLEAKDIKFSGLVISGKVTIDLNGYYVDLRPSRMTLTDTADLTIMDSSEDKTGILYTYDYDPFIKGKTRLCNISVEIGSSTWANNLLFDFFNNDTINSNECKMVYGSTLFATLTKTDAEITIALYGEFYKDLTIPLGKVVTINGGTVSGRSITNGTLNISDATIKFPITNNGTLNISNCELSWDDWRSLTNNGALIISDTVVIRKITNNGTLKIIGGSIATNNISTGGSVAIESSSITGVSDPFNYLIGSIGGNVTFTKCTFNDMTLSLDGNTIDLGGSEITLNSVLTISNKITIQNGTINAAVDKAITVTGNLTLEGVTVNANGFEGFKEKAPIHNNGTLTLKDVTIKSNGSCIYVNNTGAVTTINGGTLSYGDGCGHIYTPGAKAGAGRINWTNSATLVIIYTASAGDLATEDEVTLTESTTLGSSLTIETGDKELNLEDGTTLTLGSTTDIIVGKNATLTINGGTIDLKAHTSRVPFEVEEGGTLILNGVTISGASAETLNQLIANGGITINAYGEGEEKKESAITVDDGTMNITKSGATTTLTLTNDKVGFANGDLTSLVVPSDNTVTIDLNGQTLEMEGTCTDVSGVLNIIDTAETKGTLKISTNVKLIGTGNGTLGVAGNLIIGNGVNISCGEGFMWALATDSRATIDGTCTVKYSGPLEGSTTIDSIVTLEKSGDVATITLQSSTVAFSDNRTIPTGKTVNVALNGKTLALRTDIVLTVDGIFNITGAGNFSPRGSAGFKVKSDSTNRLTIASTVTVSSTGSMAVYVIKNAASAIGYKFTTNGKNYAEVSQDNDGVYVVNVSENVKITAGKHTFSNSVKVVLGADNSFEILSGGSINVNSGYELIISGGTISSYTILNNMTGSVTFEYVTIDFGSSHPLFLIGYYGYDSGSFTFNDCTFVGKDGSVSITGDIANAVISDATITVSSDVSSAKSDAEGYAEDYGFTFVNCIVTDGTTKELLNS